MSISQQLFRGGLWIILAEALLLPTGFLTAIFLSRQLSPSDYGLYSLTLLIITWIRWLIMAVLGKTTVKLISEAEDWQPLGTGLIQLNISISLGAVAFLWLLAYPISQLLETPRLTFYLCLCALEIPLFTLARLNQNILIGTNNPNPRAIVGASYWLSRVLLIVLFVQIGWSIAGAILGGIVAALVSLVVSYFYISLPIFCRTRLPWRKIGRHSLPLFLSTLCLRLYSTVAPLALKVLGEPTEMVGVYAATQNLSLLFNVLGLSFTPLLLAALGQQKKIGDVERLRQISYQAMRWVLLLLPLVGLLAGTASELILFIYDERYLSAVPILGLLLASAVASVAITAMVAILTAVDRLYVTFILTAPLLPLSAIAYTFLIPPFSMLGAAVGTLLCSSLGAFVLVLGVHQTLQIYPPPGTLVRTLLISSLVYLGSSVWQVSGVFLVIKLSLLTLCLPLLFLLLGEFSSQDLAFFRSLLPQTNWLNKK